MTSILQTGFFTFTLIALATVCNAQDPDILLSKLSEQAKGYGTIEATYTSNIVDLKNDFTEKITGHILVDGDQFNLNLGEYVIISDGVTVWTYENLTNDCYIDDAEMLIEEGMDPTKIFTIWEDDFKTEWMGNVELEGKDLVQINLYPNESQDKPYHTLKLYIDEAELEIVKILVKGREGMDTEYIIESFESGVTLPTSSFGFDLEQHPGVTLIDNRI